MPFKGQDYHNSKLLHKLFHFLEIAFLMVCPWKAPRLPSMPSSYDVLGEVFSLLCGTWLTPLPHLHPMSYPLLLE